MNKLIILLLCALSISVNAQEKAFTINGAIKGSSPFKYAYAFDSDYKLIGRAEILDSKFLINEPYETTNKFGIVSTGIILLTIKDLSIDVIKAENLLSNRKDYNCRVILREPIDLKYNSDDKSFSIAGGALTLQNSKRGKEVKSLIDIEKLKE